jgi:hypothetical protein
MPVHRSSSGIYHAYNEFELAMIFLNLAGDSLNELFGESVMTTSYSGSKIDIGDGLRVPEIISRRCFANVDRRRGPGRSAATCTSADVSLAFVEMKRHNLTTHGHDMVAAYNSEHIHVRDPFWQLTSYHIRHNCRYGFMSTGEYTWATRLLSSGVLSISPAFRADAAGELSTLNMMYYVLCLASDELAQDPNPWKLPKSLKSPVVKDEQGAGAAGTAAGSASNASGKRKGRDEPEPVGKTSRATRAKATRGLKLLETMVVHQDRVTWQARAGNGSLVIVKAYQDALSRDREARCYELLAPLQGVSIPRLLDPRRELPDGRGRTHALIVSWVGPRQGGNYMTLPTGPLEQARRTISAMHELGVAHGDVRPENMSCDFETGRLFVYDFSHATLREQAGGRRFAAACAGDRLAMDGLVAESQTPRAQAVKYVP